MAPLTARPSGITLDWFKYFLTQNPQWDWSTLSWASYEQLWDQSVEQFGPVFGTDNPNLAAFKDRGGKLLLWHGWADPLIYAEGTIDYFSRVQQAMDGPQKTSAFIRLFMAPGVGHCSGGTGPAPRQPFDSLVAWVEQGEAPDTLTAVRRDESGKVVRSRPLCAYLSWRATRGMGALTRRRASSARRISEDIRMGASKMKASRACCCGRVSPSPSWQRQASPRRRPRRRRLKRRLRRGLRAQGRAGRERRSLGAKPGVHRGENARCSESRLQDFVVDLGSGDGRNVIAAAKRGARALGVDTPRYGRVVEAERRKGRRQRKGILRSRRYSRRGILAATVLALFLLPDNLLKLRDKFAALKPGTRIVANTFGIQDWTADETISISDDCLSWCTVLLYFVPAQVDGTWQTAQGPLTLKQQYQVITGTFGASTIENGRVRGDEISFTAEVLRMRAKVSGDKMTGTSKAAGP